MLLCAICVTPIVFAAQVSDLWVAVLLIGLAAAAHQGWSANIFTTASDMFPKRAVGSVVGLGGMAGSVGGMAFSMSAGYILEVTGSYMTLFIVSGGAYLLALGIMQLLVPRLEPAPLTVEDISL
jgi:ACS family hexuronate transporter-like MFS transporter